MNSQHELKRGAGLPNRLVVCALSSLCAASSVLIAACEKPPAPKAPTPVTTQSSGGNAVANSAANSANALAQPPVAKAVPESKVSGPDDDQTKIEVAGLTMDKPVVWVWTQPGQPMRALQYAVPANGTNAPAAELTFSVFTGTDGGPLASNLDRWASFFRKDDGTEAPHVRTELEAGGKKIVRQESEGSYVGMMGSAAPRPGYAQFGAIIDAGDRRVFIKLVGPKETVESNRAPFDAMLKSLK